MEQSSMGTKSSDEDLNQYGIQKELLKVQQETNRLLEKQNALLKEQNYLINGFTNGGASLNGIVPDMAFLAYLSVVGPALARHLDDTVGAEEIKKGGVHLGNSLIEEFSAYSSCQKPEDRVYSSLEFLNNTGKEI